MLNSDEPYDDIVGFRNGVALLLKTIRDFGENSYLSPLYKDSFYYYAMFSSVISIRGQLGLRLF